MSSGGFEEVFNLIEESEGTKRSICYYFSVDINIIYQHFGNYYFLLITVYCILFLATIGLLLITKEIDLNWV